MAVSITRLWFDASKGPQLLGSTPWAPRGPCCRHWAGETLHFPLGHYRAPGAALSLAQVQQERDNFLVKRHRPSEPVVEQKWALKTSKWPLGPSPKTVANANLRQNLISAPPVMRHPRDKEPAGPVPLQVGARTEPGNHPRSVGT